MQLSLTKQPPIIPCDSGDGKLLAIDLMDIAGTEIRAVMFNETVDKLDSVIRQGNVR
jgi:hypothetical protein